MRWLALKRLTHMVIERRWKESFCSTHLTGIWADWQRHLWINIGLYIHVWVYSLTPCNRPSDCYNHLSNPCFVIVINHQLIIRIAVIMRLHHPVTSSPRTASEDRSYDTYLWYTASEHPPPGRFSRLFQALVVNIPKQTSRARPVLVAMITHHILEYHYYHWTSLSPKCMRLFFQWLCPQD